MKKYYKVVENNYGKLQSCRAIRKVKYKLNEWTKAPANTRLFVFDSLKDARKFRDGYIEEQIYECEIKGGIKGWGADYDPDIGEFWNLFNRFVKNKKAVDFYKISRKIDGLSENPAVFATEVKITKLVS